MPDMNSVSPLGSIVNKDILKEKLTPEQCSIVCGNGTEPPFQNQYWDNHREGIYTDVLSGEPLFSSSDKFDSGTGWPSFTKPIHPHTIIEKTDISHGMIRTEVRGKTADTHLGHVFNDGPDQNGLRYCINSAALRFIPVEEMISEGYGDYLYLFSGLGKNLQVRTEQVIFAAGCFWGVEAYFKRVNGVVTTEVGYTGGKAENPTYKEVCSHTTGHAEAVRIEYDPQKVSFETLLGHFFKMHNPTTKDRQGNDVGDQYRSAVFYTTPEQEMETIKQIDLLNRSKKFAGLIVTEVLPMAKFWPAEEYHQDYLAKNPGGYCHVDLSLAKE